jgi:leucyl aminopeptidase
VLVSTLNITLSTVKLREIDAPLLALLIPEDTKQLKDQLLELDGLLEKSVTKVLSSEGFKGKLYSSFLISTTNKIKPDYLLLSGLGPWTDISTESFRIASGEAALRASNLGVEKYALYIDPSSAEFGVRKVTEAVVEGAELALYTYSRYKSQSEKKSIKELILVTDQGEEISQLKAVAADAEKVCEGVKLARDLANTPSSDMTPTIFAEEAKNVASKVGLGCIVLGLEEIKQLGMGGILNVSRGSKEEPKVVILRYKGGKAEDKPIVLVGKGVTFDSGGISIKPSEKMEDMKYDKSGAAAVIATIYVAANLHLPLNIVAIAPLVENLPSGSAYKPGDIVKHYGGKTSEVISTDAEGRLILADVLAYAVDKEKPKAIIDLATLTGACVIALGSQASGLFGNDQALIEKLKKAAEVSGERVWQLPLWREYSDQIKSEVADMKNSGGRSGGAITAAAFLSNFVGTTPWVHLDIAGTAYTADDGTKVKTYTPKGATGVGVRLLINLLKDWKSASS